MSCFMAGFPPTVIWAHEPLFPRIASISDAAAAHYF